MRYIENRTNYRSGDEWVDDNLTVFCSATYPNLCVFFISFGSSFSTMFLARGLKVVVAVCYFVVILHM